MDQQRRKYKEPKDTLWGKCLTTFIAIVFAVSTLTIIPIASAVVGSGTDSELMQEAEVEKKAKVEEETKAAAKVAEEAKIDIAAFESQDDSQLAEPTGADNQQHATLKDFQKAVEAVSETDDVESTLVAYGKVKDIYNRLSDEDKTVVAEEWATIQAYAEEILAAGSSDAEELAVAPAIETVWQTPDSDQTLTAYSWCTTTPLGSSTFSTKDLSGLGSEEGMTPSSFASPTATKGDASYTFHHAQAQSDPQTDESDDSKKYDSSAAVTAIRYNQSNSCWEYKMSDGAWNSMNGKTLVFYYHYNQSIGSDGDVILKSKDWPYTEAEWLAGASASSPTCAVYQLYDSNGVRLDYQLRTYYYSPNADKLNNSLSIANYWEIEEVRIMPLDGKPVKGKAFNYTAPKNFSQVNGITADDPNSFTIPWESTWNKNKNACLVAVKIKALPSEQALAVKYINNKTGAVLDTANITAKKPNGTSSPVWKDYVTITGDRVLANDGYAIDNGVKVDTNIADKPATISFGLDREGYNPEYVKAEVAKGDGVTAAEVLNLYYDPLSYTVTYSDGVEDELVFDDESIQAYYDDRTPEYGETPTRKGYLFTGWADIDGNAPAETVTGDVTYYAQWDVDNIGNPDDPEKKGPDGIADKYQKLVTFQVKNGAWNTGGNTNIIEVLTFYKDGALSTDEDATASMPAAPAVGEKPNANFYEGYRPESWFAKIPTGAVTRDQALALYTYTYAAAYTVIYSDGANDTVFAPQATGNLLFDDNTPAFNGAVPARPGYIFAGWDQEIVEKVKGSVTYTATWDEDVLGNDPTNPGNTDYSDGIADKYQTIVTFAGVGGTVNAKTQFDYVVTLKDANDNYAVDGTYVLAATDVPVTAAAEGYAGDPVWTAENPVGVTVGPEGATFIANWGNGFIAYYYDGVLGAAVDAKVGVGKAISFDEEAGATATYNDHNYVLDGVENNDVTVVAGDPGQNVVSVYYALDEIGNNPANPGDIDYSDGVADKYQAIINYMSADATRGTVTGITTRVETLLDADGKYAEAGTIVPGVEGVVTTPAEGYELGSWMPNPADAIEAEGGQTYIYTFGFDAMQPDEPVNPPVDPTQPEDPDTPGPVQPTEPENPMGPTPPTDAIPTPEPGPVATLATPIAAAAAVAAVETIADDGNPLGAITALDEAIDDDANALAAFEDIHCWTHWLMIFGALVTIVYGLGVLYARRHSARDMDDFEGDIMDGSRRYDATRVSDTAPGNAFQTM